MDISYIESVFTNSLKKLNITKDINLIFETPKKKEHGDFSTNIAMQLASKLKSNPRQIAKDIIDNLEYNNEVISDVNIAGAGFINLKVSNRYYFHQINNLLKKQENIGRINIGNSKKVNVEYVSANPTGLLHLGHGRNACIGDTVANLYEWIGYDVTREYYFNNAGNQMNILAKSIYARYMQKISDVDYDFPEEGYRGDYVKKIADKLIDEYKDSLNKGTQDDLNICRKFGEKWCFQQIKNTLNRLKIKQDIFYNEDSLYKEGKIEKVINNLDEKGLIYRKDNAIWLKLSEIGLEQDRVIVKSTGESTYRLPDIAYHIEKFNRGFDLIIDIFGADHIATIPDVMASLKALGYDDEKIKVLIHQFVTLTENGKQVKMSKRTGKSYTLDELLDDVGEDVVRFFLIMRSFSTHLEFDLTLAREQSEKNPVFYLQYAHARISSLFRKFDETDEKLPESITIENLNDKSEIDLMKQLLNFEDTIIKSSDKFEPQILADYLKETASKFHIFYHNCPILKAENRIKYERLKLAEITKYVIKNGLKILGISAPDKM